MPKVRERSIESFESNSSDSLNKNKESRISVSFFEDELNQIKTLALKERRSVSSYIRLKLLDALNHNESL
jgi:hypothetical protein